MSMLEMNVLAHEDTCLSPNSLLLLVVRTLCAFVSVSFLLLSHFFLSFSPLDEAELVFCCGGILKRQDLAL